MPGCAAGTHARSCGGRRTRGAGPSASWVRTVGRRTGARTPASWAWHWGRRRAGSTSPSTPGTCPWWPCCPCGPAAAGARSSTPGRSAAQSLRALMRTHGGGGRGRGGGGWLSCPLAQMHLVAALVDGAAHAGATRTCKRPHSICRRWSLSTRHSERRGFVAVCATDGCDQMASDTAGCENVMHHEGIP